MEETNLRSAFGISQLYSTHQLRLQKQTTGHKCDNNLDPTIQTDQTHQDQRLDTVLNSLCLLQAILAD
jgi:hypothetical protein